MALARRGMHAQQQQQLRQLTTDDVDDYLTRRCVAPMAYMISGPVCNRSDPLESFDLEKCPFDC